jgi:chorismate mutase
MRGIRGATTVAVDQPDEIRIKTRELLSQIQAANTGLVPESIASILFTVTKDIQSAFPASAARDLGWHQTPLMCAREIPVPGSLPLCIRVLIHWNTNKPQNEIRHIYLRGAKALRPDLAETDINRPKEAKL